MTGGFRSVRAPPPAVLRLREVLINTDSAIDTTAAPLLLDGALPHFRFARMEYATVAASAPVTYSATRDLDLLSIHSPLFDLITWARFLPDRLLHHPVPVPPSLLLSDLFDVSAEEQGHPWVALGENPGRELVFGAIGKVWQPSIEWRWTASEEFAAFDEPGWAKIVASFVVHPYGTHRSLLTHEARTACTDPDSTERFGRYWTVVSPGAGFVLRAALQAVKTAAEGRALSGSPARNR